MRHDFASDERVDPEDSWRYSPHFPCQADIDEYSDKMEDRETRYFNGWDEVTGDDR